MCPNRRWLCALLQLAPWWRIGYPFGMRARRLKLGNWCVVIALAVALISVGFAHRTAPPDITPELTAYVAAGGQLSDLCGLVDGEGAPVIADCEACRISDTVVQFSAPCADYRETTATRTFSFVAKRIAERGVLDPARLTRAPPQA